MREGWKYKRLGDIATFINGFPFKPDDWSNKGLPIIRIQNLNNIDAAFNLYDGYIEKKYHIFKGDVLISWSGSLGVYEWRQDQEALLNQHIFKVEFNKDTINKGYFEYAVASRIDEMKSKVHGITMQHITKGEFDKTLIPVPSLAEQERIVAELDLLTKIIDKQKAQLKELDNLAQSIFYDMFGNPVENEKGWKTEELNKVCDVRDGTHDSPHYYETGYPLITSKNIIDGEISFKNVNYISEMDFDNISKRSYVDDGDIIMPMIGTIGKPTIVKKMREFAIKNVALIKFLPQTKVLNIFIQAIMSSKAFDDYMKSKNKGGTQKFIALGDIRMLKIPVPTLDIQQSFAAKIESIEQQKAAINKSIAETQKLFDYTMDKYFG